MVESNVLIAALSGGLAGALRSAAGWAENALEDGKVSRVELRRLGATVLRSLVVGFGAYFGLNLEGLATGGVALLGTVVWEEWRKFRG